MPRKLDYESPRDPRSAFEKWGWVIIVLIPLAFVAYMFLGSNR